MPLYYVHLRSPAGREDDDIGVERDDLEAAYLAVCDAIPDIAAELFRDGLNPMEHAFEITDAGGALLLEVPFDERQRRRPQRPRSQARQTLSQVERAHDLVLSVRTQVEALHKGMCASRDWVAQARKQGRP